jgi:hypothetical protein
MSACKARLSLKWITALAVVVTVTPLATSAHVVQQNQSDAFGQLASVSDTSLDQMHGKGGNIVYSVAGTNNLNATIDGSSITAGGNITNGSVSFSGNSMQNFSGLSNFVANTGNNNNLQAAMVVNVTLN